jgi:nucleoside-diphosphate-sugar epimerase
VKILLVGASGFVGRHVMRRLMADGLDFRAAVHRNDAGFPLGIETVKGIRLDSDFDWSSGLSGCDAVIHLGARVHVMGDASADPLAEYRRINVEGTLQLARQASEAGVRRFVFLSSVKANGEATAPGRTFAEDDVPAPLDPYGISKLEAECGLQHLAQETDMGIVILRPPLVYGPGVQANFLSMMRWLRRGIPLPLGSIDNRRSLIAVENLVDLIITALSHPAATNQVYMASDGDDLSTPELLRRLASALGTKAHLLAFPPALLARLAMLTGQQDKVNRLRESLRIDIGKARRGLGWQPPVSIDEGLRRTAEWFLGGERHG